MGSTFTVVVIIVAALLACAAFGLALSLQTCYPRLRHATSRHGAGDRRRLGLPGAKSGKCTVRGLFGIHVISGHKS